MTMPKCPYCGEELKVHKNVIDALIDHLYDITIVTQCCGNMVEAYTEVTIHARKSDEEKDDFGEVPRNDR